MQHSVVKRKLDCRVLLNNIPWTKYQALGVRSILGRKASQEQTAVKKTETQRNQMFSAICNKIISKLRANKVVICLSRC